MFRKTLLALTLTAAPAFAGSDKMDIVDTAAGAGGFEPCSPRPPPRALWTR